MLPRPIPETMELTNCAGILHQAWLPPRPILLLPIQHDRGPDQGRSPLSTPSTSLVSSKGCARLDREILGVNLYRRLLDRRVVRINGNGGMGMNMKHMKENEEHGGK